MLKFKVNQIAGNFFVIVDFCFKKVSRTRTCYKLIINQKCQKNITKNNAFTYTPFQIMQKRSQRVRS